MYYNPVEHMICIHSYSQNRYYTAKKEAVLSEEDPVAPYECICVFF